MTVPINGSNGATRDAGRSAFEVRCTFDDFGESLRGTVQVEGLEPVRFAGWMEFAAAIARFDPGNMIRLRTQEKSASPS